MISFLQFFSQKPVSISVPHVPPISSPQSAYHGSPQGPVPGHLQCHPHTTHSPQDQHPFRSAWPDCGLLCSALLVQFVTLAKDALPVPHCTLLSRHAHSPRQFPQQPPPPYLQRNSPCIFTCHDTFWPNKLAPSVQTIGLPMLYSVTQHTLFINAFFAFKI
jgi:hypothetical protein